MSIRIGAHVDQTDPIAEAQARGTDLVQFFLGDPQSYKGPVLEYAGGAAALRADAEAAGRRPLRARALPRSTSPPRTTAIRIPSPQAAPAARRRRRRDRRQGADRARRPRHRRRRPGQGLRQLAQGGRGHRPQAAAADREHRRRHQRDDPLPRPDRRGVGRDLSPPSGPTWSASASTPATRTPAATPRDGRRGRPEDHRPDRPGARQRQPRRLRLRRRPARQLRRRPDRPRPARRGGPRRRRAGRSARRPAAPPSTSPTSPGCASGSELERARSQAPTATSRSSCSGLSS